MTDLFSGFWGFLSLLLRPGVLIVAVAAGGLALAARAYFRSKAADGKLTAEDWIMAAVVAVFAAALAFGIWKGVA